MTSPQRPSDADDPATWAHVPDIQGQEEIAAMLKDADGQVLSKGVTTLDQDEKRARFYPRDLASLNTLRSRAEILFLTESKRSLKILGKEDCQERTAQPLHIHLKLS